MTSSSVINASNSIERLFEFFIKETAMRHFMKKTDSTNIAISQGSNSSYGNLVDLALNVATAPRTTNSQASSIHRILQNTIQEDQAARHAWMVSSRNIGTPRDRRRFRPQTGQSRQVPEDDAATTRIYRTSSAANPIRPISNSHASLIDHAILDLLPIPAGVVSITHGLPFRRPNRERRMNNSSTEEDYAHPGVVQFSHIDISLPPQSMNLNRPSERE